MSSHENKLASFTIRHRALCDEGDFKGKWRTDLEDAKIDALNHQEDHPGHVVRIVTEQKTSMVFES